MRILELDALSCFYSVLVIMFYFFHFGNQVGQIDYFVGA